MEYNNLHIVVVGLLLAVLLTGIAVMITDTIATQVRVDTKTIENGLTPISNLTDANLTLAHDDIISIVSVFNSTGKEIPGTNITFRDTGSNGEVRLIGAWKPDVKYNVTYNWYEEGAPTDSFQAGRDAITTINTNWASIIILIVVMSIIITIVLGSFAVSMGGGRRQ